MIPLVFRYNLPLVKLCWLPSVNLLSFIYCRITSGRICFMIFPGTEGRLTDLWFLTSSFLLLLKTGVIFPFFSHQGVCLTALTFQRDCFGKNVSQSPQDSGMYLIRSHRLGAIQLHQVIPNLLFTQWEGLHSPISTQRIKGLSGKGDCQ